MAIMVKEPIKPSSSLPDSFVEFIIFVRIGSSVVVNPSSAMVICTKELASSTWAYLVEDIINKVDDSSSPPTYCTITIWVGLTFFIEVDLMVFTFTSEVDPCIRV
jgi:hypothetical protein